jgi:hypothetical protein
MEDQIRSFCAQQREWLNLELQQIEASVPISGGTGGGTKAATEASSSSSSSVLHNLDVEEISIGLYGRTVVQFRTNAKDGSPAVSLLPSHRLTTGDEVEIRNSSSSKTKQNSYSGVVSAVTDTSISVALFGGDGGGSNTRKGKDRSSSNNNNDDDEDDTLGSPPFSLLPKSNVEVHRKMIRALDELEQNHGDHPVCGKIVQALFAPTAGQQSSRNALAAAEGEQQQLQHPFNPNLDHSQLDAISFALSSNIPVSLIHGPVRAEKFPAYPLQCVMVHDPQRIAVESQIVCARLFCRVLICNNAFFLPHSPVQGKPPQWWNSFSKRSSTTG